MGMFDYIRVRMPLPADPKPPDTVWFQTKDVPTAQLWMEKWTIEDDGRLIKHGFRYEDRFDKSAPEGSLESVEGMIAVEVPEDDKAIDFHGDLRFCELLDGEWWEYVARFTEGRCTRIWCEEHTPADRQSVE